jgi:hypothetical protein
MLPPSPTGCSGYEVRESTLRTHLDAGTYYIIADAFAYTSGTTMYRCGHVQLSVTAP